MPYIGNVTTSSNVNGSQINNGTITGDKLSLPFDYDDATLYLDNTNNRVGIGTTSPATSLEVARLGSEWTGVAPIAGTALFVNSGATTTTSPARISILSGTASLAAINFGDLDNNSEASIALDNSDDSLQFTVNGPERLRIDSSGRLLVGTSTYIDSWNSNQKLVIAGTGNEGLGIATGNNIGIVAFGRSGNSTPGSNALVADGDTIGIIGFGAGDGSALRNLATIRAAVDGTPGASDMPGRLVFSTTADGAASPTERLRITSAGRLGLATTAPAALAHIAGDTIISNVDVANASYDSISFSIAAEETNPTGLFFSPDGRKMFVIGSSGDDINEYTLSTPWNVSTATYVTAFVVSGQDSNPQDLYFRNDGKKLYVVGSTNDSVFQYTLTTPWSIASASYDSISFSVTTQEAGPSGLFFKPDGLAFYVSGNTTGDIIYRYNLTTAWNISTATFANSFSVSAQESAPQSLSFTADGSRMFVLGNAGDDVNIYNLTTPWDVTTALFVTVFSIAAQELTPTGLFVKPDGAKFYMVGTTNDTVYQYTIPSATIDLTGTTNINGSAEIAQDLTVRGGVTIGNAQVQSLNGGPIAGSRNRIINGDMRIDQRNAGASVSVNSASSPYCPDRFQARIEQATAGMTAQQSTTVPAGFINSLLMTVTNTTAPAAGNRVHTRQIIEGFNVADLGWGSASAQTVTLSFWVRSSVTGTYGVGFINSAENRSYVGTYIVNTANTFEYKTITLPGDTSGTWITNNSNGIRLVFDLGSGTSFNATANAWVAQEACRTSGCVNFQQNTGATFYITGVQLEPGSTATPFERRSYGQELALCQRYYTSYSGSGSLYNFFATQNGSADTNRYSNAQLPVEMRAAPTATVTASAGSASVAGTTTRMIAFSGTSSGTPTGVQISAWTASAEL